MANAAAAPAPPAEVVAAQQQKIEDELAPLQSFANHETKVFDALRASIKQEGDMFLFGEPTPEIVKLMYKLYHENIIRNEAKGSTNTGEPNEKLKAMFGILQDSANNLYVTISESPGYFGVLNKATDPNYENKKQMVLNLLKSAKVEVLFPESADKPENGRFTQPILLEAKRWRKGPHGGDNWDTVAENVTIRTRIKENVELMNRMDFNDTPEDTVNIYNQNIRDIPITVNYVDSIQYLEDRSAGRPTFVPFKKYKKNGGTWKTECNNGHLCTESKLFAYAKNKGLGIKSFVAYWIGHTPYATAKKWPADKAHEQHIIRGYCYRTEKDGSELQSEIDEEIVKLNKLRDRCSSVLATADASSAFLADKAKFDSILLRAVQPIAVACPGCFANIRAYLSGDMKKWNMSNCYVSRTSSAEFGGGKRKTRRRKQVRRKKTYRRRH
jgi:hypothetical protein